MMHGKSESLTWEGKIGRNEYCRRYFSIVIPLFFVGVFAYITASVILEWVLWSLYAFLTLKVIFLVLLRLHDVGKSGRWFWYLFVPGFNLYVMYLLFCKKSA